MCTGAVPHNLLTQGERTPRGHTYTPVWHPAQHGQGRCSAWSRHRFRASGGTCNSDKPNSSGFEHLLCSHCSPSCYKVSFFPYFQTGTSLLSEFTLYLPGYCLIWFMVIISLIYSAVAYALSGTFGCLNSHSHRNSCFCLGHFTKDGPREQPSKQKNNIRNSLNSPSAASNAN